MTSTSRTGGSPPETPVDVYTSLRAGPEFTRLRRSYRRFAFPMTVGFCAWYLLYVLLSSYAPGFMGHVLFGNVNVALVLGVLQFATTFAIAWRYARYAGAHLDPEAERLKAKIEERLGLTPSCDADIAWPVTPAKAATRETR